MNSLRKSSDGVFEAVLLRSALSDSKITLVQDRPTERPEGAVDARTRFNVFLGFVVAIALHTEVLYGVFTAQPQFF